MEKIVKSQAGRSSMFSDYIKGPSERLNSVIVESRLSFTSFFKKESQVHRRRESWTLLLNQNPVITKKRLLYVKGTMEVNDNKPQPPK